MLSRVADDVYWMSRYLERAIAVVRLVDVTSHLELDARDAGGPELWAQLLGVDESQMLAAGSQVEPTARDVRRYLAFDDANSNALVASMARARAAARGVRASIPSEMWEEINGLYLWLVEPDTLSEVEDEPHAFCRRTLRGSQSVQGLAESTLARDQVWLFFTLGKYLERADGVARVLTLEEHLLAVDHRGYGDEAVRWLAVLRSCGSAEAYARYYSLRVEPARVLEFLLLNPIFPQSVRFSLNSALDALKEIDRSREESGTISASGSRAYRALGLLRARLEHAVVDEILEEGLESYLVDIRERIAAVSDQVTRTYLRTDPNHRSRVGAVARAAMLMAAQQQQQQRLQ